MIVSKHTLRTWLACAFLCTAAPGLACAFDFLPDEAASRGGFCVVVGAEGSGEPVAKLLAAGPWAVHLLDPATGEVSVVDGFRYGQNERGSARVEYPEGVRYLRGGKRGMLEDSWTRLSFGLRYGQSAWTWGDGVEGEILAFDETAAFAFQIDSKGEDSRGRPRMWASPNTRGGGDVLALEPGSGAEAWSVGIEAPAQVEAMLAAADALVLAGPLDRAKPEGPGFLSVLDRKSGEELRRIELPATPAHDGLAATRVRLVVVLNDGSVVSFRAK